MAYVGEYRERLRDGHGSYVFPGGSFRYEGDWRRGKMHGHGVFSLPDGGSYEGEFNAGEIDGIGLRRWPDGSTYNGQFRRGERHGEGVSITPSGEVYEGHWVDNQRHGLGELRMANGDMYRGDFHHHKPHGNGRIKFGKDASIYDGDWVGGVMCGRGVLKDKDGKVVYEGEWFNGQRCGHGIGLASTSIQTSIVFDGVWADDKPIAPTTKIAFKIVLRPSMNGEAAENATTNGTEYQDAPNVITLDKRVGLQLPVLAGASLHDTLADGTPSVVNGESGRSLRLRVFEGPIPACTARGAVQPGEEVITPNQWQLTPALETAPPNDESKDPSGQDPETRGDEKLASEEQRLNEVVVPNLGGISVFEKLAMPAMSLAGTYHLVCDSVDNADDLPLAYLTLQIVE